VPTNQLPSFSTVRMTTQSHKIKIITSLETTCIIPSSGYPFGFEKENIKI